MLSGQLHGQGDLHLPRKLGVIGFFGKLHAVPQGAAVRESGRGVCREQNFRMDNTAKLGTRQGCVESSALGRAHNARQGV